MADSRGEDCLKASQKPARLHSAERQHARPRGPSRTKAFAGRNNMLVRLMHPAKRYALLRGQGQAEQQVISSSSAWGVDLSQRGQLSGLMVDAFRHLPAP